MGFNFVIWIRPDERMPLPTEQGDRGLLDKVLCFDLYEFKVSQAASRIRFLRGLYTHDKYIEELDRFVREVVTPCTVFLRPSEKTLSPEETQEVSEVGAILYEYRRSGAEEADNEAVLRALEELDRQIDKGEVTLDAAAETGQTEWRFQDPYGEAEATDLGVFANPPYRLTEQSFDRLVKRMNMPDSSWDKDD
jgi:hypothetical protein